MRRGDFYTFTRLSDGAELIGRLERFDGGHVGLADERGMIWWRVNGEMTKARPDDPRIAAFGAPRGSETEARPSPRVSVGDGPRPETLAARIVGALADGPATAYEIASRIGVQPVAVVCLMTTLQARGFVESAGYGARVRQKGPPPVLWRRIVGGAP